MEDDGTVNVMILLSQPSSVQFQVLINTTDTSAIGMQICSYCYYINNGICIVAGEDYNGSPITINVPAGITMHSLAISIIDNDIVECNEIFNIEMVSALLSSTYHKM